MNMLSSRALAPWKKIYTVTFSVIDQTFYCYDQFKFKTFFPQARLDGQPVNIDHYGCDKLQHIDLKSGSSTIIWITFISDNIFICSTDKGGLYFVDLYKKISKFIGSLGKKDPMLITQMVKVDKNTLIGVANDFLVEFELSEEEVNCMGDLRVSKDKNQRSFLKGYEDFVESYKDPKAPLRNLPKNPFFSTYFKPKQDREATKKIFDEMKILNSINNTYEEAAFKIFPNLKTLNEKGTVPGDPKKKEFDINSLYLKPTIKANLNFNENDWGFNQISHLHKHCKLFSFYGVSILVNFRTSSFEVFEGGQSKGDAFRHVAPGEVCDAIVNPFMKQLILVTFLPEQGYYHLLVYSIEAFMRFCEQKHGKR
jgi:hypothetical protein